MQAILSHSKDGFALDITNDNFIGRLVGRVAEEICHPLENIHIGGWFLFEILCWRLTNKALGFEYRRQRRFLSIPLTNEQARLLKPQFVEEMERIENH